jgi:RND family efflux transporter MFP subunit
LSDRAFEGEQFPPTLFIAELLAADSASARAGILASAMVRQLDDVACTIYRVPQRDDASWQALGSAGEVFVRRNDSPAVKPVLSAGGAPVVLHAETAVMQAFAHLRLKRSFSTVTYFSLRNDDSTFATVEIVTFAAPLAESALVTVQRMCTIATAALLDSERVGAQRAELLASVHRMTQLYDLEKSLNSTLELDPLLALIPQKVLPMLKCQAVNLWLFQGDELTVAGSAGTDTTVRVGATEAVGAGYVADMAEEGVATTLSGEDDQRLQQRRGSSDMPLWTATLAPLMDGDAEVGVLEAINKAGGQPFDEDDEFFLQSIAETVSSALKNASLLFAERKLAILEVLVEVSSEITSTLRLDRLLRIVVNSPQSVLPFDRCAIALDRRGKLQLKAISGMASLPAGDADVEQLEKLVRWLSSKDGTVYHALRSEDGSDAKDLPQEVSQHFAATGNRALFAISLNDDQGRVGMLLYESANPDFLELPHREMIKILAGQATVAIRNALLYGDMPLVRVFEPLLQRKQAFLRTGGALGKTMAVSALAVAAFLAICPLPLRLAGTATVAAQHKVAIAAPVDGAVQAVVAHEGQRVRVGQPLASMNEAQWQMDLASARAKLRTSMLAMQADLSRGSAAAGADRAQMDYMRAEVDRAQTRVDMSQLRSPIDGVVLTPSLDERVGERLSAGDVFAEVLDLSSVVVNIDVTQEDAALLRTGEPASIKLDSYPAKTLRGDIEFVGQEAQTGADGRTFAGRVPLPNQAALLRAGMTGRGKILVGYRPAGYVLFRHPALWLWQTGWRWFGW